MNRLIGIVGTTVGGALVGAGVQRTYMAGNRIASGLAKLAGKGLPRFDSTTWAFLVCGVLCIACGVYFAMKRK